MTTIPSVQHPRSGIWSAGSAAVEFAITAPLLVLLALGAADYGATTAQSSSLSAYTRAGAEYARSQVASGNGLPSASSIKSLLNIPSGVSVTFSATDPYCTCTDGTSVTCPVQSSANPCVAKTDARVLEYVSVTMTQSVTPMVSYTPLPFSISSLSNTMVVRVQ
jgi:Flp pilus assembly protein TadG